MHIQSKRPSVYLIVFMLNNKSTISRSDFKFGNAVRIFLCIEHKKHRIDSISALSQQKRPSPGGDGLQNIKSYEKSISNCVFQQIR
jgi:hypothetical protein